MSLQFIFTKSKQLFLKRTITFFLTMITLKIKIKGLGEKNSMRTFMTDEVQRVKRHKYVYENFIIRILTFCCLKTFSSFFDPSMRFYRKTRLIFTDYNVRIHPLPIKPPQFPKYLFLQKIQTCFCGG